MVEKLNNLIPEDYWRAIVENDSSYDGVFFYAVKSTGIFCRPSCKSRVPNIENVLIFKNLDKIHTTNFRPCKRCKPHNLLLPEEEWIQQIVEWIMQNYHKQLTLEKLAQIGHGSPYHLQRTFKRLTGMSPLEYIQHVRMNKAIYYLLYTNKSITDIGIEIGIFNTSYFSTLFKKKTKLSPVNYRVKYQK
ncbi:bifunctional transcriptional activator/DNA repair enzyme AdaA [Jeotgalibacillus marinus]|uniref:Bifunctional transcriptional activator/DNA repair enzyme AdaA n=1 Tax=Jeotgalibacillus marinus TaxID=86667 RepID=A0ABV3Q6B6_9BACL